MTRLSLDSFLSELTKLFQTANTKKSGSVQLAWKAYSPNADASARASSSSSSSSSSKKKKSSNKPSQPEVKAEDEPVCLLHARLNDKKISTIIPTKDVPKFHRSFSALLIVNCSEGLLAKGETKGKRKQPASSPTSPTASKKKSTKKQKKDPNAMTDVAPAAAPAVGSDSSSTAPKPVTLTRKQRAALRAANPKPHITKQQRRAIRKQPNPRKDLEKKKVGGASSSSAAPSGSAKKSNKK